MRPVARIAQSVEQGIENPCVLGSIPSPGTIFKETSLRAGFLLSVVRTLHRTPFDYSSHTETHPFGASASAVQRCSAPLSESGTLFKETSLRAGFFKYLFINHNEEAEYLKDTPRYTEIQSVYLMYSKDIPPYDHIRFRYVVYSIGVST